jgi:hypothetical protein
LRHNIQTPHKKSRSANAKPSLTLADRLSLRCGVWAKHYRLMIGVICVNGGGNAAPLRDFFLFPFNFFLDKTAYGRWDDMYVE